MMRHAADGTTSQRARHSRHRAPQPEKGATTTPLPLRASASLVGLISQLQVSGLVLDAPCGSGRNARLFAELGLTVVCLDRDENALSRLHDSRHLVSPPVDHREPATDAKGELVPLCADLREERLPFANDSFALVLNVHFTLPDVFDEFERILKPGGHLFVETVGGHGGNYRELPAPGELRRRLSPAFVIDRYAERLVRSPNGNAVVVKLLATRKLLHARLIGGNSLVRTAFTDGTASAG